MSYYIKVKDTKTSKRIIEEYREIIRNPGSLSNFYCIKIPEQNNIFEWEVMVIGPKNTSYKGGLFYLSIKFPFDYPEHGPEICFKTPIYHINVNSIKSNLPGAEPVGNICKSILKSWEPEDKIREFLMDFYPIFRRVNPESAYCVERVDEFKLNRSLYEEKIKYFTKKYANPYRKNVYKDNDDSWDFSYDVK